MEHLILEACRHWEAHGEFHYVDIRVCEAQDAVAYPSGPDHVVVRAVLSGRREAVHFSISPISVL